MNPRILVTGYESPDLDAVACLLAYSELLQYEGKDAVGATFGTPHREAQFVLDRLDLTVPATEELSDYDEVRLVDASDRRGISNEIDPDAVTEVIDHREAHNPEAFPNATLQVELVGAAATLVAERYREAGAPLTDKLANVLYAAIVSNTLDLRANVTTDRDEAVVAWLQRSADVSQEITDQMFKHKSRVGDESLRSIFDSDFASISVSGTDIGIVQLEILAVDDFVDSHQVEIVETLNSMCNARGLDHILLIGVDLKGRFDVLVTDSSLLQRSLTEALDTSFSGDVAVTNEPILRKELIPRLSREMATPE
ncbi:DHH family phosphoesterase (plasmid) [Halorussus salilacus]|uniref:DHHA2 domain-containing protein n=1 Tax=Halorussus salilacus TaxID=2953750 RepID=UPI0020A0757E|nr:DHHA2 domain-containing protein [Halorussus salilacus]USZ70016.1 DHH family phosphoesterase [Halorussus salilacus]